jgi:hypothetical protein
MKGEAASLSVRAQRCQSHYFSTTPRMLARSTSVNLVGLHIYVYLYYKFQIIKPTEYIICSIRKIFFIRGVFCWFHVSNTSVKIYVSL